jgi:hypothetical protein
MRLRRLVDPLLERAREFRRAALAKALGHSKADDDQIVPIDAYAPASLPAPRIRPFGQRIIARYLAPSRVRRVSEPINTARSCSSTSRRMQHEGERRRFGRSVEVAVLTAEALPVRGDLA